MHRLGATERAAMEPARMSARVPNSVVQGLARHERPPSAFCVYGQRAQSVICVCMGHTLTERAVLERACTRACVPELVFRGRARHGHSRGAFACECTKARSVLRVSMCPRAIECATL